MYKIQNIDNQKKKCQLSYQIIILEKICSNIYAIYGKESNLFTTACKTLLVISRTL